MNDNPIDPLGVMYLIGSLQNIEVDILFVTSENDDRLQTKNYNDYNYVGFSTITGSHNIHNNIAKFVKLKNPNIIAIMGGPHPTFFPQNALQLSDIDYICIGEGTVALNNFVNGFPTKNIINNYNDFNGNLDPLDDIDKLIADRSVIYNNGNRGNNPIKNFMGSFGCAFNCAYCYSLSYYNLYKSQSCKKVNFKNPENLVNEIQECVKNYPTKFIYIQDDTFIVNKNWFYTVTNLIHSKINLPYHCHIRCDITSDEIVKQLKITGCKSVTFAVENGDYDYRKTILNRNMTDDQILNCSKLLHKYDIKFRIENMVGLPGNNLNNNLKTLELNYKCKPTIGWASLFQPFPNTRLGNYCKDLGIWNGDIDSINPSFFDKSALKLENKFEIENLQKLFSLAINYKVINKIIKFLIKLPLGKFYKYLYVKFKNKQYSKLYSWN